MSLHGAIDDAAGTGLAVAAKYGVPLAFYGDRLNVFLRNDAHWTLAEELRGTQDPTHFGWMLQALSIGFIPADSQAKGRVERLWQTLQDRLVSELRLRRLTTREGANAFLPAFLADYNRRFARPPTWPQPAWRPPPRALAVLLGCRYRRRVPADNTVRLGLRWVQVPPAPRRRSWAGQSVELRELLDGRVVVLQEDRMLATAPSPGADFILRPRRAPATEARSARAAAPAARQHRPSLAPRLLPPQPRTPASVAGADIFTGQRQFALGRLARRLGVHEAQIVTTTRRTFAVVLFGVATLSLPALIPTYYLILLSSALALAIACLALNLLLGTTGLLSFGHAAYFGLGAYAGGFLYTLLDVDALEAYLLAGMVAAGGTAAIFGALCVRATRVHFTILTLAVAQIVHSVFISGIVFRAAGGVGRGLFLLGGGGLYIPRLPIVGHVPTPEAFPVVMFYVVAAAFALCAWLLRRLTRSPFGLTLRAISGNPTRAALVGIRVRRYQWSAFVISGTLTGLAGGLTGLLDRQVTPEQLHWVFSAKLVLATVLGGVGYFWGPSVGAAALVALRETALRMTDYWSFALGALLVLVTALAPGGIVGLVARLFRHPGAGEHPWDRPTPPGKHG